MHKEEMLTMTVKEGTVIKLWCMFSWENVEQLKQQTMLNV